jgi:hypothetical protein
MTKARGSQNNILKVFGLPFFKKVSGGGGGNRTRYLKKLSCYIPPT